jgi:hypothetical protein
MPLKRPFNNAFSFKYLRRLFSLLPPESKYVNEKSLKPRLYDALPDGFTQHRAPGLRLSFGRRHANTAAAYD